MLIKNVKTGAVWAVTEKVGSRLLRTEEFERAEYVEDSRVKDAAPHTPLTELPEYEKVTAKVLKAELTHRNISFEDKADKQELYDLLKADFEKAGE